MGNISIVSKSFVDQLGNLYFDVSYRDGDELIEKRVPVEEYLALLDGNVRVQESLVTIPKLSENVIAAQIGSIDKSSFKSLSVYKADKRAFAIAGEFFRLPFPALLMYARVRKGARQEVSIFALDTDEPTNEACLYHYPFGNVYEGGDVCMGNIVSEDITSIASVDRIFDDFICGVTNEHLYKMQNKLGLTQLELVKYIEKMDVFPTDLLVPTGTSLKGLKKQLNME